MCPFNLIISTPERDLRLRADNQETHETWLRALSFLQSRPITNMDSTNGLEPGVVEPKPMLKQRKSLSQLIFRQNGAENTRKPASLNDNEDELENVRACCGGKHDLDGYCPA